MELSVSLLEGFILAAGSGLFGWLWFLHGKIHEVELKMSDEYQKKADLRDMIRDALDPLTKEIEKMAQIIEKLRDGRGQ